MGLTATGYVRRTFDDILNDKIQRAKELFGENIDTGELTPLGKFIRINAYDQAQAEEEIEAVFYARFPNTALGQNLDRLMPFAAITRNQAEAATYSVEIEGTPGHIIEMGFLVGTEDDLTFHTTEEATIGDGGICTVKVSCTEPGSIGNINASSINRIVNPDANIEAVEGVACLSTGRDEESDADLRARFNQAVSGSGSCNANAIRAALLRIPTVRFAAVIENESTAADADGRPPHSFECYVLGGADYHQEIAEAIFEKRPIGVKAVGDIAVNITDASGNVREVRFSETRNVSITVKAKIKTTSLFPADGAAQVQAAIANQINALGVGASVILSTLYGPIHGVPGVAEVTSLQLSTDGGASYNAANIAVEQYGVAICAAVHVEVAQ